MDLLGRVAAELSQRKQVVAKLREASVGNPTLFHVLPLPVAVKSARGLSDGPRWARVD